MPFLETQIVPHLLYWAWQGCILFHAILHNPEKIDSSVEIENDLETVVNKLINSDNKDMLSEMLLIIPKLSRLYKTNAFKILINNGKKANQEVDHLHFHFLGYK